MCGPGCGGGGLRARRAAGRGGGGGSSGAREGEKGENKTRFCDFCFFDVDLSACSCAGFRPSHYICRENADRAGFRRRFKRTFSPRQRALRDGRFRPASAGQAFTAEDEEEGWAQAMADFFGQVAGASAPPGAAKTRANKRQQALPRLASLDWTRSVEGALASIWRRGLRDFGEDGRRDALAKGCAPLVLCLCTDPASTQTCPIAFHQYGPPALTLVHVHDPHHRRSNDAWLSISDAKLSSVFFSGLLAFKIGFGPWQGGGWFRMQIEAVRDIMSSMHEYDPLLLKVWPGVTDDMEMQYDEPEKLGSIGRRRFLDSLDTLPAFNSKGPKASVSRWFSWWSAFRFFDQYHSARALVLLYIAIRKGWIKSADDVWQCGDTLALADSDVVPAAPSGAVSSFASAQAQAPGQAGQVAVVPERAQVGNGSRGASVPAGAPGPGPAFVGASGTSPS